MVYTFRLQDADGVQDAHGGPRRPDTQYEVKELPSSEPLEEAKARLESALNQMEEGVVILDAYGRTVLLNPAAYRIVGSDTPSDTSVADWPGKVAVCDRSDQPVAVADYPIVRALRGETVRGMDMHLHRPDGVTVHVVVNAQPLYLPDGRPAGALSVFRDVTAENRARSESESLRRLAERLTIVTTPDEIADVAYEAALELFNPDSFVLDLYQPTTNQLASILLVDTIDGTRQRCFQERLRPCGPVWPVLQGQPMVINRAVGDERDDLRVVGSGRRSASLIFVPIRKDGDPVGLLSIQSYTLYAHVENDLALAQELADLVGPPLANAALRDELERRRQDDARHERLRSLGQMASGVAHNFNNALTGVLGYAELLLMRPDLGGDARSMVESIRASGRDAAAVIARLMKFCRAQELARDFVSLDLNDVIRDVVQASQRPPHAENSYPAIHWRVNLCAASPVWGHVADLREVIANLIANAVRAMPQGGTVVVGTCVEDSSVILEIADTGIGMPKEVREHCFEPFYVPKAEHGAGLGLAIVHGIIKRHGGRIDVWSEPDQGTRFTIHLPRPNAHDDASADGGDANNP